MSGCKLVEMDIEIKEEFKGKTLRQKFWPMPKEDAEEIEKQVKKWLMQNWLKVSLQEHSQNIAHQHFWSTKRNQNPDEWLGNT